jgi:hypothetical protein
MGPFLGSTSVDARAECVICFTVTVIIQSDRKVTQLASCCHLRGQ